MKPEGAKLTKSNAETYSLDEMIGKAVAKDTFTYKGEKEEISLFIDEYGFFSPKAPSKSDLYDA